MDYITSLGQSNQYLKSDSESARLYSRARQLLPSGCTRSVTYTPPYPPYIAYGQGCRVVDIEGVERIDFHNNFTALILGHANPMVVQAVSEQLAKGTCFSMPTETEVELASVICHRVPSIERIRFANSGTEAVMAAIRGARAFTGKTRIAKFEGAFHGAYDFVLVSLSPDLARAGSRRAPSPVPHDYGSIDTIPQHVLVLPWNDPDASMDLIADNRDSLAAVVVDPMPRGVGFVPPTRGFLEAIRKVTSENDIILIFDEVISFRLGYGGAQGRFGITPDLTVLGKIVGGGFPVGAMGGRAEIMEVFNPEPGQYKVYHGGTYTGNPITMVAGAATMKQLTLQVFERLEELGDRLRSGVTQIMTRLEFPGQITGLGSNFVLHMTNSELSDYRSTMLDEKQKAMKKALWYNLLAKGVIIASTGMACLSTPMGTEEIDTFLQALEDSLIDLRNHYL